MIRSFSERIKDEYNINVDSIQDTPHVLECM